VVGDDAQHVADAQPGGPGGVVSGQANPSSAEPSPGRFLTMTYDLNRHAIVGVFTRTGDYTP
jgi:hypothetical protein